MIIRFRAVDKDIFHAIQNGEKTVETRAYTPKYQNVTPGQRLTFVCENESIKKLVESVRVFKDAEDLAASIRPRAIHPRATTADDLQKMYDSFPGYKDKIRDYGLVAWELTDE